MVTSEILSPYERQTRLQGLIKQAHELRVQQAAVQLELARLQGVSTADVEAACKKMMRERPGHGGVIAAIKQYRNVTGCSLMEANDVVDAWVAAAGSASN